MLVLAKEQTLIPAFAPLLAARRDQGYVLSDALVAAEPKASAMRPEPGSLMNSWARAVVSTSPITRRRPAWRMFERSTGFRLPDGSVFSPDASLLRSER